jgi:hypothetical protein
MNREQLIDAIIDTTLDGMGMAELSMFVAETLAHEYETSSEDELMTIAVELGITPEDYE